MEWAHFCSSLKVHPTGLVLTCITNFRYDLSTALIAQTFEDFNDRCTKVDGEVYFDKKNQTKRMVRFGITWPLRCILKLLPSLLLKRDILRKLGRINVPIISPREKHDKQPT